MPAGGRLTIATRAAGPEVLLRVADTGLGMSAEVRARACEPFFTTKEAGKGTGMGLATVCGIVRQAGGRVEVESEPGRGATFTVYLPLAAGRDEPAPPPPRPAAAPRGRETVLLVEDEGAVRALGRQALQGSGYTVLEATHGGEALRLCERHRGRIDLLVTDVVMPEVGGRQLAARLAALRPDMRVLFVSGYGEEAVLRPGTPGAGAPFLQKPFTPLDLARKVRAVLDAPAPPAR
jgi:CheY-like chemotaxis protein